MVEDVRRTGMRRFEGQSVIVTGGASGIGEATAARFLSEGARVLMMDVSAENIAAAMGVADDEVNVGAVGFGVQRGDDE